MRLVKSPNDLVFATALILLAAVLYWPISELRMGTSLRMGPGYMPTVLCGLIAVTAAGILLRVFFVPGEALKSWPMRPLICVFGGLLLFGLLLERTGMLIAMPVLVALVSAGDRDARWHEVAVLAVALTLFSAGVFVTALRLPIDLWPAW